MRFVIYDDETLEPITVVNIRGFTEQDIEEHDRHYRLAVPSEIKFEPPQVREEMRIVDLTFEVLIRGRITGERQKTWMCFTKQDELALLLVPDWLPGQRGAIKEIQRHNERLNELLLVLIGGGDR